MQKGYNILQSHVAVEGNFTNASHARQLVKKN